jgi:signal transduction histidine kinase
VSADEVKITQVFYNLLLNAINYTGIDRTITVCQSIDGSKVRIAVTDSGGRYCQGGYTIYLGQIL